MLQEEKLAKSWSQVPEIIKRFQETRLKKRDCWIFIDEKLIPKDLLVEDKKTKGIFYLKHENLFAEFDSYTEYNGYWLMWQLRKEDIDYFIEWIEKKIFFFIKKDST